jgi:repressor of nif and glnA expression
MTMTDLMILEFLCVYDLEIAPTPLHRNLQRHGYDVGYSTVKVHTSELEKRGLLEKDSDGYYEISDRGEAYLNNELEPANFEDE